MVILFENFNFYNYREYSCKCAHYSVCMWKSNIMLTGFLPYHMSSKVITLIGEPLHSHDYYVKVF